MTKKGIFLRTMDIFSILRTIFAKFHHSPPILKACILRPSQQKTKDIRRRILHTRIFHCRKKRLAASLITKHLDRHTFCHNILPNGTAEEIPPLLRLRHVKLRKADGGRNLLLKQWPNSQALPVQRTSPDKTGNAQISYINRWDSETVEIPKNVSQAEKAFLPVPIPTNIRTAPSVKGSTAIFGRIKRETEERISVREMNACILSHGRSVSPQPILHGRSNNPCERHRRTNEPRIIPFPFCPIISHGNKACQEKMIGVFPNSAKKKITEKLYIFSKKLLTNQTESVIISSVEQNRSDWAAQYSGIV